MNKYITSSIFVAAGLGTVNAAALDNITDMRGSDTLFATTQQAIISCGASCVGHMTYLGTGSGNGESAIYSLNEKQSIAPMSKFLGTAGCGTQGVSAVPSTGGSAISYSPTQVEQNACGMVIGLDAVSIYSSVYTGGSLSCNDTSYCDDASDPNFTTNLGNGFYPAGTSGPAYPGTLANVAQCSAHDHPTINSQKGLAYDRTVNWATGTSPTYGPVSTRNPSQNVHTYQAGTYTFANWTDVLRVIYTGYDHNGCQDCESDVRNALVSNWGLIFEAGADHCSGGSSGGAAAGGPTCTQLRHAFRRDDQSGTTETFLLLLGLPGVTKKAGLGSSIGTSDPFCNSAQERQAGFGGTSGTIKYFEHGTKNPPARAWINPLASDAPPDFRDRDPIRRSCASDNLAGSTAATEQVCDIDGKLGVVLPIIATDYFQNSQLPVFPTTHCAQGKFTFGPTQPLNPDGQVATAGGCPNSNVLSTGNCLVPIDSTGNPNCMADKTSAPTAFGSATLLMVPEDSTNADAVSAVATANTAPGAADGRIYNLQAYYLANGSVSYVLDNTLGAPSGRLSVGPGRGITGMFTRIHSTLSMNSVDATKATCQFTDATQQLGCLVQASECSISYAGATAGNYAPIGYQRTAAAMLINGEGPISANINNGAFLYPLGRKLYLNTYIGFGNVWGPELALAKTEATVASINPILSGLGFFTLTGPFYEDYNEKTLCGAGTNVNGCANDPLGIQALNGSANPPTVTTCGDLNPDQYEDCDNGASNVTSCPSSNASATSFSLCNTTCRTAYCFVPPGGVTAANYCPATYGQNPI